MKILKGLLFVFLVLISIILVQNARFQSRQTGSFGPKRYFSVDSAAVNHLCLAVQIPTVSNDEKPADTLAFQKLKILFHDLYPSVFGTLEEKDFLNGSFMLKWKGNGKMLKPVILYAHLDVVPGDSSWSFSPFEGRADSKFIYGRGVIDDKGAVISILETLSGLIASGFTPQRDIYFAFGHDEEMGGREGAKPMAEYLKAKGIKADFLLDEGGIISDGMVPFVDRPVALVAIAEKGYVCFRLSVESNGGHSSMPPAESPVEILASVLQKIHDHPFDCRMTTPLQKFIDHVGPEMSYPYRALFANSLLFRPLIFSQYEKIPGANAMIRTTSVTTLINGGVKENTIPEKVTAVLNVRMLQGDRSSEVLQKLKAIIADKPVKIEQMKNTDEPSDISSVDSEAFRIIDQSIRTVFPDVIVSPYLNTGGTDSKHFRNVTDNIYRFLPARMNGAILEGMHGKNEKIEISSFMEMMAFYEVLLKKL